MICLCGSSFLIHEALRAHKKLKFQQQVKFIIFLLLNLSLVTLIHMPQKLQRVEENVFFSPTIASLK